MGYNFIVPCVVYPYDIFVSVLESDLKVTNKLKKILSEDECSDLNFLEDGYLGICCMLESGKVILRLRVNPLENCGVLVHEVFHAVEMIFNRIGLTHSRESSEAWAYLIEYLTNKILEKAK